jgi:hypothetical protein
LAFWAASRYESKSLDRLAILVFNMGGMFVFAGSLLLA